MAAGYPACGDPLITDRERWCAHSVGWWWRETRWLALELRLGDN